MRYGYDVQITRRETMLRTFLLRAAGNRLRSGCMGAPVDMRKACDVRGAHLCAHLTIDVPSRCDANNWRLRVAFQPWRGATMRQVRCVPGDVACGGTGGFRRLYERDVAFIRGARNSEGDPRLSTALLSRRSTLAQLVFVSGSSALAADARCRDVWREEEVPQSPSCCSAGWPMMVIDKLRDNGHERFA